MNKIIENALNLIKVQNFYVTSGNKKEDVYAVYTYISVPAAYADNIKQGDQYTILINLNCKNNIEKNKQKVIEVLNEAGLVGGTVKATVKEETGYYNTAIIFNYYKSSK